MLKLPFLSFSFYLVYLVCRFIAFVGFWSKIKLAFLIVKVDSTTDSSTKFSFLKIFQEECITDRCGQHLGLKEPILCRQIEWALVTSSSEDKVIRKKLYNSM